MAKNLNLKSENIAPNTVRVSWTDTYKIMMEAKLAMGLLVGIGVGFILIIAIMLQGAVGFGLLLVFAAVIGVPVLISLTFERPNAITIAPDVITHGGHQFSTATVSRVEYALSSEWTGNRPRENQIDPFQIRLWFEDDDNYPISTNNWEKQINHKIRNAIDNALTAVRDEQRQKENVETHGKQGDFGVPEY